jgi:hypothetical protein
LLGQDSELDPAFLTVKNRVRHVSLFKDVLIFRQFQDRFASPYLGEKGFGIEPVIGELPHIMTCPEDLKACRLRRHGDHVAKMKFKDDRPFPTARKVPIATSTIFRAL